jgi:hypothetical protein
MLKTESITIRLTYTQMHTIVSIVTMFFKTMEHLHMEDEIPNFMREEVAEILSTMISELGKKVGN